jgi:hypothetical protein
MNLKTENNIEIFYSRNNLPVPKIMNFCFHSNLNPIKEAIALAQSYEEKIKLSSNYLIFGLGFGYHIDAIIEAAQKYHDEIGLIIIEPNQSIVDAFIENINSTYLGAIRTYKTIEEYFFDDFLLEFLISRPVIIKHPQSFDFNQEFFTEFLTFKFNGSTSEYVNHIKNKEIANSIKYFQGYENENLSNLVKKIKRKKDTLSDGDFVCLFTNEVATFGI